jgi:hypothetical protein
MSRKLRKRHGSTGLVYWYADELDEIAHLITLYGIEAIQTTAAAVACSGKDPLPRVVEKELQQQQRAIRDAVEQHRRKEAQQQAEVAKRDPDRQARARAAMEKACRQLGQPAPPHPSYRRDVQGSPK